MYPLLGLLAALGIVMWRVAKNSIPGVWTPERQALYRVALATETDPKKLAALSAKYAAEGFPEQAAALKARIAIPSMTGEDRRAMQAIVRKAFGSKKPHAVRNVAAGCERLGMGATAEGLRQYAIGLDIAQKSFGFRGAPFPNQFHGATSSGVAVPQPPPGAVEGPPNGPIDVSSTDAMRVQHEALHQDHRALHRDHAALHADHGIIMAALTDIQSKLNGAPWLQGVTVAGEGNTECIVVLVTDATPDVIDAIPTHSRGVPVRVQDGRG